MKLAAHSIILERIATLLGILLLVLIIEPFAAARLSLGNLGFFSIFVFGGGLAGVVLLTRFDRMVDHLPKWQILLAASKLASDARRLFYGPAVVTKLFVLVLLAQLNYALSIWWIAKALGLEVSLQDCMVFMPLVLLVSLIPISIGGWGVREGAVVVLFGALGVSASDAISLSVLYGLFGIASTLPGAVMWWLSGERLDMEKAIDPLGEAPGPGIDDKGQIWRGRKSARYL